MGNLEDIAYRRQIIDEINNDENKDRKKESLKRFEIYKNRHDRYILQKLEDEFSEDTVREMRKVTSINIAPRIIKEQASIYSKTPERTFGEISEREIEALEAHYDASNVDVQMKLANEYYKLFEQCAIYVIPMNGKLWVRPLAPHWYDVIPTEDNPEIAETYILNILDKHQYLNHPLNNLDNRYGTGNNINQKRNVSDGQNQKIADRDDYKSKLNKYVVWNKDWHFTMNGEGTIISDTERMENPLGVLPFIDIASEKDFEFFCRFGNTITDFAIDFGVQLSDHSNILRMQGYSQAIVAAEKEPTNMVVGPNHTIFLQQDPNSTVAPSFSFASPSPDLSSSLETLEVQLKLLLTAQGVDPKTISGTGDGAKFNSGLDRLLAMIDKFEATRSDYDLFRAKEDELKDLIILWNNALQDANDPKVALDDDLRNGKISEECTLEIMFKPPEIVQTKTEKEDSIIKLLKEKLMTKKEAIMEIREVDEEMADKILEDMEEEQELRLPAINLMTGPIQPPEEEETDAPEGDEEERRANN